VQWLCLLFQTTCMFGERGIVLCLFSLKFSVQLDNTVYLPDMDCFLSRVFCVTYYSVTLYRCVLLFSSVYCTVHCSCIVLCLLVMYVLLP
jgi:hypothetical protein